MLHKVRTSRSAIIAFALAACAAIAISPALADEAVAPKVADTLKDLPTYGEALIRMVVILISMLIALFLAARFLPRWFSKSLTTGKSGAIKVLDSLQLEPRKRLYLVQVGQQVFLVGTSEQGVQMLADRALDSGVLVAQLQEESQESSDAGAAKVGGSSDPAVRSFADVLRKDSGGAGGSASPAKTGA
ncbi:MAG: flagellar biosynthetic protein FliO [Phycisphaeraceae bacterium]